MLCELGQLGREFYMIGCAKVKRKSELGQITDANDSYAFASVKYTKILAALLEKIMLCLC